MDSAEHSGHTHYQQKASRGTSYSYSIDPANRLVHVRFFGKLVASVLAHYVDHLKKDPEFNSHFSEIADLTAIEQIEMTPAEAIALADAMDPFDPNSWRAFVSCKDIQTNAARMHQILRSPARNTAIFDSVHRAEEWILACTLPPASVTPRKKTRFFRFPSRPA